MKSRIVWGAAFAAVLAVAAGPWVMNHAAGRVLKKNLDFEVHAKFVSGWPGSHFELKELRFDWDERIRVESGGLSVDYRLRDLISASPLRVRLSGENLKVRLLGDWAEMQDVEHTTLEHFDAEMTIAAGGIEQIHRLIVQAPEFQFDLQPSEAMTK